MTKIQQYPNGVFIVPIPLSLGRYLELEKSEEVRICKTEDNDILIKRKRR